MSSNPTFKISTLTFTLPQKQVNRHINHIIQLYKNRQLLKSSNKWNPNLQKNALFFQAAQVLKQKPENYHKAIESYIRSIEHQYQANQSVRHICLIFNNTGYTDEAVKLLKELKLICQGRQFDKILQDLIKQTKTVDQKQYKKVLLDLRDTMHHEYQIPIDRLFEKIHQIQQAVYYCDLSFQEPVENGRYLVLEFFNFKYAQQVLDTFNYQEWFAIDMYWLDCKMEIACLVRQDGSHFRNGLLFKNNKLHSYNGILLTEQKFPKITLIQPQNYLQDLALDNIPPKQLANQQIKYKIIEFESRRASQRQKLSKKK